MRTPLPTPEQIRDWVDANPDKAAKRDIARAFGLKGSAKAELGKIIAALRADGAIAARPGRGGTDTGLPPVAVLEVTGIDKDGTPILGAAEAVNRDAPARKIRLVTSPEGPALGTGDRLLARMTRTGDAAYDARPIRRIGVQATRILGVFRKSAEGGRIVPIDKGSDREWLVARADQGAAKDGKLVEAMQTGPKSRLGLPRARVTEVLGDPGAPKAISLIAIHAHGIPDAFPDAVMAEAERVTAPPAGQGEDLRDIPFVTIDPADARDRDDAVAAVADPDKANPGGHILWVAIADVAAHVRPASALDREARKRGNSSYFPDRVVPMLPDRLSGDLCSLHDDTDKPVIALRIVLDAQGNKIDHAFHRGWFRSRASLNYEEVQAAIDGAPNARTEPLLEPVLRPLWAVYRALKDARERRQPLDLDLPERRIELSDEGHVTSVAFKDRLDAHRLIEECMVLANVAAAETLEAKKTPLLYRVHEEPSPEKIETLREIAQGAGIAFAKGQVLQTRQLNRLLHEAAGKEGAEVMNMAVLRSMTQAYYSPENFGHFGLALRRYAHFTSPIRRYADLIVHRALITAHGWGKDGLSEEDIERLDATGELISETERRSMAAERDTTDRYLAAYLAERMGTDFEGRVSGIARFGLFVRLDETGADGLIPLSTLGREYFHFDAQAQTLTGDRSGQVIGLGQRVTVRLAEAEAITGGLRFELLEVAGTPLARSSGSGRKGRPPARKTGPSKAKRRKIERAAKRRGR